MTTLGKMKASGESLVLFCRPNEGPACYHATTPSLDQLIQYFGVDFDPVAHRKAFLAHFVCQKCGGRFATMSLRQGTGIIGVMRAEASHDHGPLLTVEEATKAHHEREAERRRLGIKTSTELNAESRERLKAQARGERQGEFFIGPPSPWARRKKGRWL